MKEESKKFEGLLNAYINLLDSGSKELSKQVHNEMINKISLVCKDDWIKHQICSDLPLIDHRCLIFCCSPKKNCPFRELALKKIGLTIKDYTVIKKELGEKMINGVLK